VLLGSKWEKTMKKRFMLMVMMMIAAGIQAADGTPVQNSSSLGPMDIDGNGEISKTEYLETSRKRAEADGRTPDPSQTAALGTFNSKDKNRDGVITSDELTGKK
jgi:hypothetical protein